MPSLPGGDLAATNYDFTPLVTGTLTITQAHLTVTADDNHVYGDPDPMFNATVGGFVLGQTLATSGVTGAAVCTDDRGQR